VDTTIELRPSPWKHLLLLVLSGGFVALAVLLDWQRPLMAWITGILFGLGMLMALITLVPGSSFLRLERECMSVRTLYRTWHVRRSDIARFFVASVGGREMVCWNYVAGFAGQCRGRALAQGIAGVEAALPDTYGCAPGELAALLNNWLAGDPGARPNNSSKPTPLRGAA
jgi:hypothetical protein